jgi:hypothetical protein
VIDCARRHPPDVVLTVADSALRHGSVTHEELLRRADAVRTTGRAAAQRVAREVMFQLDYVAACLVAAVDEPHRRPARSLPDLICA